MTRAQEAGHDFSNGDFTLYDSNNNEVYWEDSDGDWVKQEYDSNNNEVYGEDSDGYWAKREYDSKNNQVYYESSDGYWIKTEFDSNNNEVYWEDSYGYKRGVSLKGLEYVKNYVEVNYPDDTYLLSKLNEL